MRHIVIDNWGPNGLINAALAEWPDSEWRHWHLYHDSNSIKRATKDASRIPRAAMLLLERMASLDLDGIGGDCFPDLELYGAGMNEIPTGGFLGKHLDSTIHPQTGWGRAANGILFLNSTFGGRLIFDDAVIEPQKNRLVLFETTDSSFHEVETVEGEPRKSLSLFWWKPQGSMERMKAEFTNEN